MPPFTPSTHDRCGQLLALVAFDPLAEEALDRYTLSTNRKTILNLFAEPQNAMRQSAPSSHQIYRQRAIEEIVQAMREYVESNRPLINMLLSLPAGPQIEKIVQLMLRMGESDHSLLNTLMSLSSVDGVEYVDHLIASAAQVSAKGVVKSLFHENLSTLDAFTGLLNKAYFHKQIAVEVKRARSNGPLSLLLGDIDHFKKVNDVHGHPVGDEVILETAERLREKMRRSDILGRVGGEEFAMLLPNTYGEDAVAAAKKVLHGISDEKYPSELDITMSLGVAQHAGTDEDPIGQKLLEEADAALYVVKQNGRNGVAFRNEVIYQPRKIALVEKHRA